MNPYYNGEMLILAIIFGILLFTVIALFAFPALSPIPYFPSNPKDMNLILESLKLKNNQIVIDLGAGDGLVIFQAAQRSLKNHLNITFIATEINPVLILILFFRQIFHPNGKNIRILYQNMFKGDTYKQFSQSSSKSYTFYLYISPWFLQKVYANIRRNFPNAGIVSYMYAIPDVNPKKIIQGIHKIFVY